MPRRILALIAILALPLTLAFVRRAQRRALVPQPRGMVLGLYAGLPDYDYGEELDRIAKTGATCVSLQAIYRMDTGQSSEIRRHPTSSPSEAALVLTFQQAKARGLRMMFFPTLNMRDEAENAEWWRGNISPDNWDLWWQNYTAFNVRLATLAQAGGVEWFSLGTEMASTQAFPDQWRRLAAAVREVYKGKLVYSVNFDSHDSFTFGDCLDVIGINTYDPIAKYDEYPSDAQVRDAWWWVVYKARTLTARFQRPVMITEVGYPSVAHAHVGPWDFRTEKPLDLALQNHLLKGAFGVLRHWSDGDAVFFYLYGENLNQKPVGGPLDRTYAVWGKPAEATLLKYFREPTWEGHIAPRAENIHEAMVQSLVSWHRKLRDYEDAELPPWVVAWETRNPGDSAEALAILAKEPKPDRKIPKGDER
jgi:hypothetical protein